LTFGIVNALSNVLGILWIVVAFNSQFTPLPTTTIESDEIVIAHGGNRRSGSRPEDFEPSDFS
jgi:hypothetical protein